MAHQRVLITGGAGFIGCAVAQRLVAEGRDVLAVDSLHPQVHKGYGRPSRLPESVPLFPFDVTSSTAWDGLLKIERPSVLIHLAAETGTGQSLRAATTHGSVNVVGTTQMLDALSRNDHVPDHILLTSSRAVYGEGAWTAGGKRYYPTTRTHRDLSQGVWDPPAPDGETGSPLPSQRRIGRELSPPTSMPRPSSPKNTS